MQAFGRNQRPIEPKPGGVAFLESATGNGLFLTTAPLPSKLLRNPARLRLGAKKF
jgi:hypothetical protein